jgi:hypothetical protein
MLQNLSYIATIGTAIATLIIALGLIFSRKQLKLAEKQLKQSFEERFNAEYRSILKDLPYQAFMGTTFEIEKYEEYLPAFFRYFDLSNEECFLNNNKKIEPDTWAEWRSGIIWNFKFEAFRKAWDKFQDDGENDLFKELKVLLQDELLHSGKFLSNKSSSIKRPG